MRLASVALVALVACGPPKDEVAPNDTGSGGTETSCTSEIPYDGIDQDCDGADLVDVDGDGFDATQVGGPDCDDQRADVGPGALDQTGDDVDENCDGVDGLDGDGDGYASIESGGSDCDDADGSAWPGAPDAWDDGVDSDCAGDCDYDEDGDGVPSSGASIAEGDACDTVAGPGVPIVADCDDSDPLAQWALVSTAPAAGELVARDATFAATFTGDASSAVLSLADAGGNAVAGTTSIEGDLGEIALFTPSASLVGGASYTFSVSSPCGDTLADVGTLIDTDALVGTTWSLDLLAGNWISPPMFGALFGPLLGGSDPVALEIVDAATGRVGAGDYYAFPLIQDRCVPTSDALLDTSASPVLSTAAGPVYLELAGTVLTMEDATVSGTLANGSSDLTNVELFGALDVTPLDALIGAPTCPLLATFGIVCGVCPVGGAADCLHVDLAAIPATRQSFALDVRTDADILADPGCP